MGNELIHYGVKGMKWGVRKARTGQLDARASRNERVAAGKGSLVDKAVTLGGSSALRLGMSGGLKNEAARRAKNKRAEIKRLATGKAKVTDILKAYGTVSAADLGRAAIKKTDFEVK
uniref:Uncharacterized protein n=1 Tax=Streptomyces phage Scarif TaxID=3158858 RepID=A0AAU7GX65_9CAUD